MEKEKWLFAMFIEKTKSYNRSSRAFRLATWRSTAALVSLKALDDQGDRKSTRLNSSHRP